MDSEIAPGGSAFLAGGTMRTHDWSVTPLGLPETWPPPLRSAVGIMLGATAPIGIYWGADLVLLYNDAWRELIDGKHPQALGRPAREVFPEIWETIGPMFAGVMAGAGGGEAREQLMPLDRGGLVEDAWFDYSYSPIPLEDGTVGGVLNFAFEVTARVRAERALGTRDARVRAFVTASSDVVYRMNSDWSEMRPLDGKGVVADALGPSESWLESYIHPDDQPRVLAAIQETIRTKRVFELEHRVRRVDGSLGWTLSRAVPLLGENGEITEWFGAARDVTARRQAVEALRESEARFRHMADSAPALIWMTDETGAFTFANMHFDHLFGRPAADFLGDGWKQVLLPEEAERFPAMFMEAFHARRPFRAEVRVRDKDGKVLWLRCEGVPRTDDSDRFLGYTGCDVDITGERLAAEVLERRVAERTAELMAAEATLRQAQKMEAVGQLTGGIAHDFNNMLQAISGSLELMQRRIAQGRLDEGGQLVDTARKTVERAAALTHRLLAFARQQVLQPGSVKLEALIEGMAELIRRTVGPEIAVVLRPDHDSGSVLCDPGQLESALLNLAINARDAMPEGGTLTISTSGVCLTEAEVAGQEGAAPGNYVEIAVADTGSGMDEATQARAFEPFFTTKPVGQGTGLGLSQIYGFTQQSGGIVRLDSAPGRGTTVRLYLPRPDQPDTAEAARPDAKDDALLVGMGGMVLLVEDEASVREVAAKHLREVGYEVLEAGDGPAALRLLRSGLGARVDVLVTDVGLPGGLNGRQVADMVRECRPGLPVLFITGYAGAALEGQLAPSMAVIIKPFPLDLLAAKVRDAIKEGQLP